MKFLKFLFIDTEYTIYAQIWYICLYIYIYITVTIVITSVTILRKNNWEPSQDHWMPASDWKGLPCSSPGVWRKSALPWMAVYFGAPLGKIWPWSPQIQDIASGSDQHSCGKSPLLIGILTISMAIFNSYVKLPEGIWWKSGAQRYKTIERAGGLKVYLKLSLTKLCGVEP